MGEETIRSKSADGFRECYVLLHAADTVES